VDDLRDPIEVLRTNAPASGFGDLDAALERARAQARATR
jgi:hypothetical protein